jgi:hypothetical protein
MILMAWCVSESHQVLSLIIMLRAMNTIPLNILIQTTNTITESGNVVNMQTKELARKMNVTNNAFVLKIVTVTT